MKAADRLKSQHSLPGSASIFVVIFTMLIISTIVVGFTGIMLREQSQASDMDLSKSAYDSALAGVEDAKRAVNKFIKGCGPGGTASSSDCATWKNAFSQCNSNRVIVYGVSDTGETKISTSTGPGAGAQLELNRAYTCVKTTMETPDYIGSELPDGQQAFIPLRSAGSFNTVKISWFSRENINRELTGVNRDRVNLLAPSTVTPEFPYNTPANWPSNRPPVLRAQYIQTPATFSLTDFDETSTDGLESNTNSVFMYPVSGSASNDQSIADVAARFDNTVEPWQVSCRLTVTDNGYACSATLSVPSPLGGGAVNNAYLVLKPFYNLTDYKIELLNGATIVNFNGVQPQVDSTGRANDIFRRVAARIEPVTGASAMPVAAVETSGNFCKTFAVTDQAAGYSDGACNPNEGL